MISYFPVVTGSLVVLGNVSVSGSINTSGSITISGSITSASFASTASFVALAQSASNAVSAQTASFANTLTVAGNLTAQTLVVQTITSSVDFVTGSTRFGSIAANTHVFTGSMSVSGSGTFASSITATNGNFSIESSATNSVLDILTLTHTTSGTAASGLGAGILFRAERPSSGITLSRGAIYGVSGTDADDDGDLAFYTLRDTGAGGFNEKMRITSAGNVGIGLTPFANTLSNSLDLINGGGLFGYNNQLYVVGNAYFNSQWLYKATGGAAFININSAAEGNIGFVTAPSGTAGTAISFAERMRITSDGKVLIGTTSDNSFNFVASPNGHSFLGNTMQISAGDYGGTERQGAVGVAEWANVSSATINLATIFPRINFTSRTLSVLVQIGNASTTTTMCSCLVLFGRTINGTWSSSIIGNININGLALSSASGSGTSITLNFGTATFGSAMITILNRA
jgi:hypothetical protein